MIDNIKHINDYNLVHKYLCGDDAAGEQLYAALYPVLKGFIYNNSRAKK
ncbi:MAG: hypothetical protein Q7J85_03080 [Bacillota bacterium]|nr:hypothetical protein [Bacillota bacterium]